MYSIRLSLDTFTGISVPQWVLSPPPQKKERKKLQPALNKFRLRFLIRFATVKKRFWHIFVKSLKKVCSSKEKYEKKANFFTG